jgi:hypothetical protein
MSQLFKPQLEKVKVERPIDPNYVPEKGAGE